MHDIIYRSRTVFVLREMVRRYFSDGISKASAELAYFLLFSFFPLLMFLNSVLAMIPISAVALDTFTQFLPIDIQDLVAGYWGYISRVPSLSPFLIGIGLTLYFLSRSVSSLIRSINRIYHIHNKRSAFRQTVVSFTFTAGFMLAIILSFLLLVVGKVLMEFINRCVYVPEELTSMWHYGRYLVTISFIFLFLLLLNYIVPNCKLRIRDAVPGALFSLIAWVVFSIAFSFYVENMSNYSVLYGSLGAIMILMLWLYLTGIIMLMGTQLNHILLQAKDQKRNQRACPHGSSVIHWK